TGSEIVAVRKPAGEDYDIDTLQVGVLVPDVLGLLTDHILRGVIRVVVAIAAGKHHDAELHVNSLIARCRPLRAAPIRSCAGTPRAVRSDRSHAISRASRCPAASSCRRMDLRPDRARRPASIGA